MAIHMLTEEELRFVAGGGEQHGPGRAPPGEMPGVDAAAPPPGDIDIPG